MARPRPIPWLRAHPNAADGMLALVIGTLSVIAHLTTHLVERREPSLLGAILVGLATYPVAFRRRFPVATLAGVAIAQSAVDLFDFAGAGIGLLIMAYSIGSVMAADRRRSIVLSAFAAGAAAVLTTCLVAGTTRVGDVIGNAVVLPSAFFLGDNLRRRRERLADLAERAERTEREQELLARDRVNEERSRIARELHDVVAHSVSVMVIQAAAARRQLGVDREKAANALENIEQTGRNAMHEMRRILGVLRSDSADDAELAPQPSLSAIESLVDADSSLPIRLVVRGDRPVIPAGVELSAYRVVQEALTNVRKHAGPCSKVTVMVQYRSRGVEVVVHDDGRGAAHAHRPEPGHGLVGMRERVASCGGELSVGPAIGGGWRVRARFPLVATGERP